MEIFIAFLIATFVIYVIYTILKVKTDRDFRQEQLKRQQEEEEKQRRQVRKLNFVRTNSPCLKDIKQLNSKFKFEVLTTKPPLKFSPMLKNKSQFDTFDIDNFMFASIEEAPDFFSKEIIAKINKNRSVFYEYDRQFNTILNYQSTRDYTKIVADNISVSEFKVIEREECQKIKLLPDLDCPIELNISYISPKGQSHYQKPYIINFEKIVYYWNEFQKRLKNKESAEYQRSLVTPKLRYQILKRDGFKCVLCGRTEKDGAKLHVDHIFPVSKGGKTEENNLRTLCDMCNLGKGASYDPSGIN